MSLIIIVCSDELNRGDASHHAPLQDSSNIRKRAKGIKQRLLTVTMRIHLLVYVYAIIHELFIVRQPLLRMAECW